MYFGGTGLSLSSHPRPSPPPSYPAGEEQYKEDASKYFDGLPDPTTQELGELKPLTAVLMSQVRLFCPFGVRISLKCVYLSGPGGCWALGELPLGAVLMVELLASAGPRRA